VSAPDANQPAGDVVVDDPDAFCQPFAEMPLDAVAAWPAVKVLHFVAMRHRVRAWWANRASSLTTHDDGRPGPLSTFEQQAAAQVLVLAELAYDGWAGVLRVGDELPGILDDAVAHAPTVLGTKLDEATSLLADKPRSLLRKLLSTTPAPKQRLAELRRQLLADAATYVPALGEEVRVHLLDAKRPPVSMATTDAGLRLPGWSVFPKCLLDDEVPANALVTQVLTFLRWRLGAHPGSGDVTKQAGFVDAWGKLNPTQQMFFAADAVRLAALYEPWPEALSSSTAWVELGVEGWRQLGATSMADALAAGVRQVRMGRVLDDATQTFFDVERHHWIERAAFVRSHPEVLGSLPW